MPQAAIFKFFADAIDFDRVRVEGHPVVLGDGADLAEDAEHLFGLGIAKAEKDPDRASA